MAMVFATTRAAAVLAAVFLALPAYAAQGGPFAATDRIFEEFRLDAHAPGLVYGVVENGKLVHVKAFGVQDIKSKRPVTPDSLFRIASMTKAFTALTLVKLRDDGLIRFDALAEDYVPELRGWRYPTLDSPRVRVRDLLTHTGGFVTDDPWGDRQTPLPEDDFTRLLETGVPFTRAPGMAYEYSNFGYALLGRIIANAGKRPYAEAVQSALLTPLGMSASGLIVANAPQEMRALGYRWENDMWIPEPDLGHGSFSSIGAMQVSANDYAKWVAFLLSAWPPRDDPDNGPVKRASVRELAQGVGFVRARPRPSRSGGQGCLQPASYSMGMNVTVDCELGLNLSHGGGYPGYGSHMLLFPERGVGLFVFANRTYAGPTAAIWDAAVALHEAGRLGETAPPPLSGHLAGAYKVAGEVYTAGNVKIAGASLAMNFLMDKAAETWARDLARLKAGAGDCDTGAAVTPTGALSGTFNWRCTHGRIRGSILLSPDTPPRIQRLDFAVVTP
ncbi:MAG: serine hydrolase domain-containing protein [Rhodospirillaceae bacterium]